MGIDRLRKKNPVMFAILIGTSVVLFWRGMWGLLDLYLFPNIPWLSYVLSVITGLVILYVTHFLTRELE